MKSWIRPPNFYNSEVSFPKFSIFPIRSTPNKILKYARKSPKGNEIIYYTTPEGSVHIEVLFQNESFWLSQKKMSELFGVESNTITYHLKEIYKSAELQEDATTRKIRVVQKEGSRDVSRDVDFYNLDAIYSCWLPSELFPSHPIPYMGYKDATGSLLLKDL